MSIRRLLDLMSDPHGRPWNRRNMVAVLTIAGALAVPGVQAQMRGGARMRGMMTRGMMSMPAVMPQTPRTPSPARMLTPSAFTVVTPQTQVLSSPGVNGRNTNIPFNNPGTTTFPFNSSTSTFGGALFPFGTASLFNSGFGLPFNGYGSLVGAGLANNLYGGYPLGALPYLGSYGSGYGGSGGGYGGGGSSNGISGPFSDLGRFEVYQQQAALLQEQLRTERLANRRKEDNQNALWPEDERKKFASLELERSRNNPPVTEIQSGQALNALLTDLSKLVRQADWDRLKGFPLPLDGAMLDHINVSHSAGNIGLLRNKGALAWPLALNGPELKGQRDDLTARVQEALRQAEAGSRVDLSLAGQMRFDVDGLRRQLRSQAASLSASLYIDGSRFLSQLDDSIRALEQRDASNHFNGTYFLKNVKTVAELVNHMNTYGLHFAPGVPGDESAYRALHRALAACDRVVAEGTGTP